ncbi:MAG: hypothetical protein K0S80_3648 [Neobacillus sp.]|nr:hypothetical protein [Neobacillus sp.]
MKLRVSDDFRKGFIERKTNSGNITYSADGKIATVTSISGANNGAMLDWHFLANPGDVIEISVWGRAVAGEPRIALDIDEYNGNLVQNIYYEKVKGSEWKLYKSVIVIPETVADYSDALVVLGIFNAMSVATNGQFRDLKVTLLSSNRGAAQTVATGLIRVTNGVVDLHPDFRQYGIESVSYSDITKDITVTLSKRLSTVQKPIIAAVGTPDNPYPVLAGQYTDAVNPYFKVSFTNGTAKVSLASGGFFAYVTVNY